MSCHYTKYGYTLQNLFFIIHITFNLNDKCCPHPVELLTNLREFYSARRRGEGPQYGPSRFFLGLLGAFSGLLGAFSGNRGFSDLLGPSPSLPIVQLSYLYTLSILHPSNLTLLHSNIFTDFTHTLLTM